MGFSFTTSEYWVVGYCEFLLGIDRHTPSVAAFEKAGYFDAPLCGVSVGALPLGTRLVHGEPRVSLRRTAGYRN
jgi:hypothetical protein